VQQHVSVLTVRKLCYFIFPESFVLLTSYRSDDLSWRNEQFVWQIQGDKFVFGMSKSVLRSMFSLKIITLRVVAVC
jgi:hypothetical protein